MIVRSMEVLSISTLGFHELMMSEIQQSPNQLEGRSSGRQEGDRVSKEEV